MMMRAEKRIQKRRMDEDEDEDLRRIVGTARLAVTQ